MYRVVHRVNDTYINKYIKLKKTKYMQSGGYTQALSYCKNLAIRGIEDAQPKTAVHKYPH